MEMSWHSLNTEVSLFSRRSGNLDPYLKRIHTWADRAKIRTGCAIADKVLIHLRRPDTRVEPRYLPVNALIQASYLGFHSEMF